MPVNVVKVGADGRLPAAAARGAVSETCNRSQTASTFSLAGGVYQGGLVIIQADGAYDRIRLLTADNVALSDVRLAAYSIDTTTGTATMLGQTGNVATEAVAGVYATGTMAAPVTLSAGDHVALLVVSADNITLPFINISTQPWKAVPPQAAVWGSGPTLPSTFNYNAAGSADELIGLQIIPAI